MKEYNELLQAIRDYDNEAISYKDLLIAVRDISNRGIEWLERLNQDNM